MHKKIRIPVCHRQKTGQNLYGLSILFHTRSLFVKWYWAVRKRIVFYVTAVMVFTFLFPSVILVYERIASGSIIMGKTKRVLYTTKDVAMRLGEGLFSYAVDIALWNTIFMADLSIPFGAYGKIFRAQVAADRFLRQWNYDTIKEAVANARRQQLLKPVKRGRRAIPEITRTGKRRLAAIIPIYDEKRVWDGRMHLITYDVPEVNHTDRDTLREMLRRLGAGKLQDSVWITPYNPVDIIRITVEKKQLAGSVIVSDMGRDGAIGEEDLASLIVRIWRLDVINDRYEEWLREYKRSDRLDQWLVTSYFTILRDDPQLPFTLLPKWWKGDRAWCLVAPKVKELYLALRP